MSGEIGNLVRGIGCCLACLFAVSTHSQTNMINYQTRDGLPSDQVYQIHQDHNGLIWLATDRGIASFNGSFFTTYTEQDGLPDDVVFRFFPQADGQIWCATKSKAIFHFHPDTLQFHLFTDGSALEDLYGVQIRGLKIDEYGTVRLRLLESFGFVEIFKNGVVKKHSVEKRTFRLDVNMDTISTYSLHRKNNYFYYHPDPSFGNEIQQLEVAMRDVFIRDSTTYARTLLYSVQIQNESGAFIDCQLKAIPNDIGFTNHHIWIATRSGIQIIDRFGSPKNGWLEQVDCSYYLEDLHKGKWFATLSEGIYYLPPTSVHSITQFNGHHIHSLGLTQNNNLVVGKYDFEFQYLNQDLSTKKTIKSERNRPTSDYFTIDGQVENILDLGKKNVFINKLSDDKESPAIKSVKGYICFHLSGQECRLKIPVSEVYDAEFIEDRIVAAGDHYLFILNTEGEILYKLDVSAPVQDVDVFENHIYCGIKGMGIGIFTPNLSCIDSITNPELANSSQINEIIVTKEAIWAGSVEGLSRSSRSKDGWKVDRIGRTNGLLNKEVEDLLLKKDTLYIATRSGLNYFDVNEWNDIIHSKNNVYFHLRNVLVNDSIREKLTDLSHHENRIQVEYGFAAYPSSNNLLFRYKLIGFEKDWNYTKDRKILYKSLPPGEYEMRIQAQMDNLPVGSMIVISIEIHEAFYKTWWFAASIFLVLATIIWLFFKYQILAYNRELIREILRNLMKRVRLKDPSFTVRSNGYDVKVKSTEVRYVESNGNYINIYTQEKKIVVREKLSNFMKLTPDPLEYLQIRRSLVVRLDQISSKSIDHVEIGEEKFKVGNTYLKELDKIQL